MTQLIPFQTQFDTDWAYAGYGGMRGIGTGSINLSGVTAPVNQAYLYWHGPTNTTNATANATVNFNGNSVTGTNIGFSDNNCWQFLNSQAYLADVTSFVTGGGAYSLAGFVQNGADINGASLLAFFKDGDTTNNRDVVLFHGNDSNINNIYDPPGWDINLTGINYDGMGSARLVMGVSDGQSFPDDALTYTLNGVPQTPLAPTGPIFEGDSVPNGPSAANTNGGLWDIKPFSLNLGAAGPKTIRITTGVNSDCLSAVHVAVDLPAGAAPGRPTSVPEPTSGLGLLTVSALTVIVRSLRGKK